MITTNNNIQGILSNREMGNPSAQQQLRQWYSRVISENIRDERYEQIILNLSRHNLSGRLQSYDRKDHYIATFTGCTGANEFFYDCAVDFWDIVSRKKLWSYKFVETTPVKCRVQITDDLHVILPRKHPKNNILILSRDKETCIDIPQINTRSTRVIGNHIAAYTPKAFFVWDTKGNIQWSQAFPDNKELDKEKIAISRKYYISQLGGYSHSTGFQGTSLFFVADLDRCKASFCRFDLAFDLETRVTALSVHEDTLYVASCEFEEINYFKFYKNSKIQRIDLLDLKSLSTFTFEFLYGFTKFMISTPSRLICVNTDIASNVGEAKKNRIEILSSNLREKEKSFAFKLDNACLEYGKYSSFNSDYCSTGGRPIELSSIPEGSNLGNLNVFNDFSDGVFVSFDSDLFNPRCIFIKDYKPDPKFFF